MPTLSAQLWKADRMIAYNGGRRGFAKLCDVTVADYASMSGERAKGGVGNEATYNCCSVRKDRPVQIKNY